MSDWDRFAAEEYELLVAEEGNAEGMDDLWVPSGLLGIDPSYGISPLYIVGFSYVGYGILDLVIQTMK